MKYFILSSVLLSMLIISGCSKSKEDYLAAAKENLKQKNMSEAINNYKALVEKYPESKEAPEALSQIAKVYSMQNKITEVISNYEAIVDNYSSSSQAPEALFQIATLYQNKMVKDMPDQEAYTKAEKTFREVFDKYPGDEKAPMALFLSGFILANDLKNFEEATSTYNLFLQKYPDHQLAASAREELNNMGLSPDQILKKKGQNSI
jgi:TolA-binding protein